jgi:uncharacterized protein with PIN domain
MIKSRKVIKKEIEYFDICPECNKEIKGSTEGQVKYNLEIHIDSHERKLMKRKLKNGRT